MERLALLLPKATFNLLFTVNAKHIPRRHVYAMKSDLTLSDAIPEETISRDSIVREMDINVVMTPAVATSFA
jgi:hypothetical protein